MKVTTKIILALGGLAVLPAMLNAKTTLNFPFKNQTLQSHTAAKPGAGHASGANATNSTTVIHLHGKSQIFEWDSTASGWQWVWQSEEITKYDLQGREVLDVYIDDTIKNDSSSKEILSYDANGSEFDKYYSNSGNGLTISGIDTNLNDSRGSQIRQTSYNFYNNQWQMSYEDLFKITYDGNGHMTSSIASHYNTTTMQLENTYENNYILNSDGSCNTVTEKYWNGSAWINYLLTDSFAWKSWNGGSLFASNNEDLGNVFGDNFSAVEKSWNGNSWQDSAHITFSSSGDGIITYNIGTLSQVLKNGIWVNSEKDSFGIFGDEDFRWNGNKWVQYDGEALNYTYDANGNATQIIHQGYDVASGKYVNEEKDVYSDFSTLTGIKEANTLYAQISLYPNPATATLHLQGKTNTSGNTDISIYNLQGQTVLSKQINSSELSAGVDIQVNNLANGIYILHTVSNGQETNQKFVKE